jgi:hypothetical protein
MSVTYASGLEISAETWSSREVHGHTRETVGGSNDRPESGRLHDSGLCGADRLYKQGACANGKVDFQVAVQAAPQLVGSCSVMNSGGGKVVRRTRRCRPDTDRVEQYQSDTGNRLRYIRSIRADKTSCSVSLIRWLGDWVPLGIHRPKIRVARRFAKADMFPDATSSFSVTLLRTVLYNGFNYIFMYSGVMRSCATGLSRCVYGKLPLRRWS